MIRKCILVAAILAAATTTAFAQAPGMVHIMLPNGNDFVQSSAASGTLSSGGITCTWTSGANSATVTFVGNYTTTWIDPAVDLAWFSTSGVFPITVTVTSAGTGTYDFRAPFLVSGGSWNNSLAQPGVVGNLEFGQNFPPFSRMDIDIELLDQGVDYDVTIEYAWGPGVPADQGAWGGVKALFR